MRLDAFLGKEEGKLSHALAAFRFRYDGMTPRERQDTHAWVDRLAELDSNSPRALRDDQRVCIDVMEDTPHGGLQVYRVPARVLQNALSAWEHGGLYTLTLVDLLGDGIQLDEGY